MPCARSAPPTRLPVHTALQVTASVVGLLVTKEALDAALPKKPAAAPGSARRPGRPDSARELSHRTARILATRAFFLGRGGMQKRHRERNNTPEPELGADDSSGCVTWWLHLPRGWIAGSLGR